VFVDESSTNVALVPLYARAPRGRRAFGKAPRNWGRNVTLTRHPHQREWRGAEDVAPACDPFLRQKIHEHQRGGADLRARGFERGLHRDVHRPRPQTADG